MDGFRTFDQFMANSGLSTWLNHPDTGYSVELIREFYASATQAVDGRVPVRGVELVLNIDEFNQAMQTVAPADCAVTRFQEEPDWDDLLAELTGGAGQWSYNPDGTPKSLAFDQLTGEARVLFHLVASRFIPIMHLHEVNADRAVVTYCLMKGRPFNVAALVVGTIQMAIIYHLMGLPFPQLLTTMLRDRGVPLENEPLVFGRPALGDTAIRRIMGILARRIRRPQPHPQLDAEDEAGPSELPQGSVGTGYVQTDYLASLSQQMQHQIGLMTRFDQRQNLMMTDIRHMQRMMGQLEERQQFMANSLGVDTSNWSPASPSPEHSSRQQQGDMDQGYQSASSQSMNF